MTPNTRDPQEYALDDAVAGVRERHQPNKWDVCVACRTTWPCDAELLAELVVTRAALNAVPPEPLDGEATAAAPDPDAETMPLGEVARRFPLSVASAHEADPQVEHDCRAGCFSGGCGPCWTTGCGHHGRHALQTPRADR